jgi:uncharacterized repeat protein (TIGR01451 family)
MNDGYWAVYTTTAQDLVTDTITTATGTAPDGDTPTSPPSTTTVDVAGQPAITLTKSATPASITAVGQRITYSFLVTNTGSVTLTNATVTDQAFTGTGPLSPVTCPAAAASLAAGASVTCTATYTTTQADIDAGQVTNAAIATGTPPPGLTPPDSGPSTAAVGVTGVTRLGLTKTGSAVDVNGDRRVDAGDRIDWTLIVTNLGATTVDNIIVADAVAGAATCAATQLAPGASMTCTVPPRTISTADAAAGHVTNTATATGATGNGTPVTSDPARATISVSSGSLPVTGRDLGRLVVTGLLAILGGAMILMAGGRFVGDVPTDPLVHPYGGSTHAHNHESRRTHRHPDHRRLGAGRLRPLRRRPGRQITIADAWRRRPARRRRQRHRGTQCRAQQHRLPQERHRLRLPRRPGRLASLRDGHQSRQQADRLHGHRVLHHQRRYRHRNRPDPRGRPTRRPPTLERHRGIPPRHGHPMRTARSGLTARSQLPRPGRTTGGIFSGSSRTPPCPHVDKDADRRRWDHPY